MSWANSVLPIFTSDSSEKLRIAPDQVQIDTTHLRPQATAKSTLSRTHSPSTGQQCLIGWNTYDPRLEEENQKHVELLKLQDQKTILSNQVIEATNGMQQKRTD